MGNKCGQCLKLLRLLLFQGVFLIISVVPCNLAAAIGESASLCVKRPQLLPVTILIAGDSIMEDFGPTFQQKLQDDDSIRLVLAGKRSTGLCRPDFYNWPLHLAELLRRERPHVLIFCVGANDCQPIREAGKTLTLFSDEWNAAYARRVMNIISMARRYRAQVIWLSVPPMGAEPLASQIIQINRLVKNVCQKVRVPFVETRYALTDRNGRFSSFGRNFDGNRVRMRTEDRVHITRAGNERIAVILMPVLKRVLAQIPLNRRLHLAQGE